MPSGRPTETTPGSLRQFLTPAMSYLFVQTIVIQLFVGIAFLLLGLWGGKYLWGPDRHHPQPSPTPSGKDSVNKKAEEELRKLRVLNAKLEKENHLLREKVGAGNFPAEDATPNSAVEDTLEIIDVPVEPEDARAHVVKAAKPAKALAKPERDELIRIRGIGKVMADKLEKRGIRTYRQLAEWTKEEIEKLPYGSRVSREKWQTQARRLHKEKYGDKI